jgi:DNA-binding NtrC family response regulator
VVERLLCFGFGGEGSLEFKLPEVISHKWHPFFTNSIDDAKAECACDANHDGLVNVDALDGHTGLLEELFSACNGIEWITLLSRNWLEDPRIRHLIVECCYDYHTLPSDPERLMVTLGHAFGKERIRAKLEDAQVTHVGDYEMVGASPVMQQLFRMIRKIGNVDVPVLITGESGTGKELTAVAIHERSSRAKAAFVAINCGAVPPDLIQSELFGYERGAFTGAVQRKIGYIEAADHGTLFLDEIGDLPLELQVNLLRFLQEKKIKRVGSTDDIAVDVRVIAATNIDLEKAVREGRFREDLYYRLNVLHVKVPALRERREDIEVLARFYFNKFRSGSVARGFHGRALREMASYSWPGNIRELINRIRRATLMCEGPLVTVADLGLDRHAAPREFLTLQSARHKAEKEAIRMALQRAHNNVTHAAADLGISRVTLYRLADKHKILAA